MMTVFKQKTIKSANLIVQAQKTAGTVQALLDLFRHASLSAEIQKWFLLRKPAMTETLMELQNAGLTVPEMSLVGIVREEI